MYTLKGAFCVYSVDIFPFFVSFMMDTLSKELPNIP